MWVSAKRPRLEVLSSLGQPRDAVPLQAAMQGAAGEVRDGVFEAPHEVVERQQGAPAELDDDRFLGWREHGATWRGWPHWCVRGGASRAPLGDGLGVQAIAGGQGPGALFRTFGARLAHTASF